ncbi:trigger factor [Caulobacter ginsengisoli]|uniref:Trigger factor n=1 Tax=Caulobacter ginsengisoli TaxID=400775 RepID=A0ABU0ILS4_9CAUL|nr:trigger factor [Caulobacter ginsengisoli]MDQ0462968.1 trigger factor [Caulobacter ginsengisoli]
MQIVEKSGEGLSRVYGVTVPAGDLADRLEKRIAEILPTLNLKGFRPGKVPVAHVKRLYGKSLMSEVIEQTLNESTQKVLDDNQLRPAGQPDLTPSSDMDAVLDGKTDLAYDLAVEVMPDFEPLDMATLKLKRPVYSPTDKEVDEALADLAKQARTYAPRTGKTVKAKDGDQVLIDFLGSVDGVPFDGGKGEGFELVLGSGQFIPGFEEQLVGAKPDSDVTVKVTFPEPYQSAELAGKNAEFAVHVHEVRAPVDAEPDDALAERVGMKDLAALKDALRSNLEGRYANASRFKLKRALLDELDTRHDFPLPPRMVEAEFAGIWQQVESDKAAGNLPEEDAAKSDEDLKVEYRKIAERRVRLGLVLAEIGRRANVQVTDQELTEAMRREAMQYGAQAQQVFDLYRQNPQAQASLRAPLYEDKVVELIFSQAKIDDKKVSKKEIEAEDDLPEGY